MLRRAITVSAVKLAGALPANEGCAWTFDDGDGAARHDDRALATRKSMFGCAHGPADVW